LHVCVCLCSKPSVVRSIRQWPGLPGNPNNRWGTRGIGNVKKTCHPKLQYILNLTVYNNGINDDNNDQFVAVTSL
jgi:hypothetical protein